MTNSELLLPVGNIDMCMAAIHNGADAIYVGMPGFNARGRTIDHEWDDLKVIIDSCHLYDVRVHLAFNILIFESEIQDAIHALDKAVELGVDAFIVQDLGLAHLIRKRYPQVTIHGSTQMSITNYEAIELLKDLKLKRVVLGRENSIDEIAQIKEKTETELEVFVHGALCVAYSGQCFTSEALGGRSANRGQCAQSCRFDYELYVDGKKKQLVEQKYLVSPQDLCGINEVPKLQELGVESFKVEGRLKSPEYVATVAKNYKEVMQGSAVNSQKVADMAVTYSRGFYSGWLHGVAHQELAPGKYNSNRGQYLGEVTFNRGRDLFLDTEIELALGDGLLVVGKDQELGEKIYHLDKIEQTYKIKLGPKFNPDNFKGQKAKVFLTRSERIIKAAKKSVTDKEQSKRLPLTFKLSGRVGEKLTLEAKVAQAQVSLFSDATLEKATGKPLDLEDVKKKLSSLSHTPYKLVELQMDLDSAVFLPNKIFKQLKQNIIRQLNETRLSREKFVPQDLPRKEKSEVTPGNAKLNILIRKIEQLTVIEELFKEFSHYQQFLNFIILDFEFGKDYFPAVKRLKDQSLPVAIATTRILKPGEYHNFRLIERCEPDALLIRNLGALNYFKGKSYKLLGDFSLNCANSFTYEYLLSKGLESQCASYDLNTNQLTDFYKNCDPSKLEITLHQYMPEFHMEHCVFAAYLSNGNSFRDCGKPCEKHEVHLKDMYGQRHEIKADQECRNTMFRSEAQSTISYLERWIEQGISNFRFECLHDKSDELAKKLKTYFQVLSGELTSQEAFKALDKVENYGLGLGQMNQTKVYKDRKKS